MNLYSGNTKTTASMRAPAIKKMPIVSGTKEAALFAIAPLYVAKKMIVRIIAKTMFAAAS